MEVMKTLLLLRFLFIVLIDSVQGGNFDNYSRSDVLPKLMKGDVPVKRVYLNQNGSPIVYRNSALREVFTDENCQSCIHCMERAIKAHRIHKLITSLHPSPDADDELYTASNVPIYTRDPRLTKTDDKTSNFKSSGIHTETVSSVTKMKLGAKEYFQVNETKLTVFTHKNRTSEVQTSNNSCVMYEIKQYMPCNSTSKE